MNTCFRSVACGPISRHGLVLVMAFGLAWAMAGCSSDSSKKDPADLANQQDMASPDGAQADLCQGDACAASPDVAGDAVGSQDSLVPLDALDMVADLALPDLTPPFQCRSQIPTRIVDDLPDETFDLGPYLVVPTPTSIIIRWRTLEETDGAVLYGEGDSTDIEVLEPTNATIHLVRLEGLKPDTRYAYRVRSGGVTGELHHFYTAPPEGGSFRFSAWGDNQGGEPFPAIVAKVISEQPHIVLGLGDHVSDGQVDELWKTQFFGPARALMHEVAMYESYGNHGYNGHLYYDLWAYENISVSPKWESVYSFTYGNTFFLVIDTNGLFFPIGDVDSEWSTWIKQQMDSEAAKKATWRIAYAHEPGLTETSQIETCGVSGYTFNKAVTTWLLPALEEHGFHAYLAGHVHWYERSWAGKMVQIISGGGGGGLDDCPTPGTSSVMTFRHHVLRGLVGCDTLRIEAVDLEGNVFDWIELGPGAPGNVISQGDPIPVR